MREPFVHETIDHPATPGNDDRIHDYDVDQHECVACHEGAHAQYAQDVTEEADGSVDRVGVHPVVNPDGTDHIGRPVHFGPTAFLAEWHRRNGHCPSLT